MNVYTKLSFSICKLNRDLEGLLEDKSIVKLKDILEVEDLTHNIIGRVGVTNTDKGLMGGLKSLFSFSKKKEPEIIVGKNEMKVLIFKRMPENKFIFSEGQSAN